MVILSNFEIKCLALLLLYVTWGHDVEAILGLCKQTASRNLFRNMSDAPKTANNNLKHLKKIDH